jgi:hypothetical protein
MGTTTPLPAGSMELIEKLALQVPSLVVLVIVVWLFLRYMNQQRKDFSNLIGRLHEDHLDARKLTREALADNTEAMREISKAVGVIEDMGRSCAASMSGMMTMKK